MGMEQQPLDEWADPLGEPSEVPPSVILDKLQVLLESGKLLLRFRGPESDDVCWGINGCLDGRWCSFRVVDEGACDFVDDESWLSEPAEEWADSELECLERLRKAANAVQCSLSPEQPLGNSARECQKAFDQAKIHAESDGPAGGGAEGAEAKESEEADSVPAKSQAKTLKASAKPQSSPKPLATPAGLAVSGKGATGNGTSGKGATSGKAHVAGGENIRDFLQDVKGRLLKEGRKAEYIAFAKGIGSSAAMKELIPHLGMHRDLVNRFLAIWNTPNNAPKAKAAMPPGAPVDAKKFKASAADPAVLKKQVEYYLSDENLKSDKFFRDKITADSEGWMEMSLLLSCNKMKNLQATQEDVVSALKDSDAVELKDGGAAVRRPGNMALPAFEARPGDSKGKGKGKSSTHVHDGGAVASFKDIPAEQNLQQAPVEQPAVPTFTLLNVETEVLQPIRERGGDVAVQLLAMTFRGKGTKASHRLQALRYVRERLRNVPATKEVTILRGPPAVGKAAWASEQINLHAIPEEIEKPQALLTHVCSIEEFLPRSWVALTAEDVARAMARNEAKLQLAIEARVQPLIISGVHAQLWEMGGYVRRAKKMGYSVNVVGPDAIYDAWKDVDALMQRSEELLPDAGLSKGGLESLARTFEDISGNDPAGAILSASMPSAAVPSYLSFRASEVDDPMNVDQGGAASQGVKRKEPP